MREKKGYALKRGRGLVPHLYDRNSRAFQSGAFRWWPKRWRGESDLEYNRRISHTAFHESASRQNDGGRWHRFVRA